MEHEMRKYIDTFKERLTENLNISDVIQRSVYLLTNDGHRDSVNLQHCAMDDAGLKKILIEEMSEIGQFVIEDTIDIKHSRTGGWIFFKYKDYDDDVEDGKCGFFKLNVV
jgi:hypothetical protein